MVRHLRVDEYLALPSIGQHGEPHLDPKTLCLRMVQKADPFLIHSDFQLERSFHRLDPLQVEVVAGILERISQAKCHALSEGAGIHNVLRHNDFFGGR